MNDPVVTIIGNLTRNPELRVSADGRPVATFTVAVTPRVPDGAGGWRDDETWFVRCAAFERLAENICDSLSRGSAVIVSGRLRWHSWVDGDGQRRGELRMLADAAGPSLRYHVARQPRAIAAANPEGGVLEDPFAAPASASSASGPDV